MNRDITKEQILELTNMAKRKSFLDGWASWPVWCSAPEIGLTVYRVDLPDGYAITASRYEACGLNTALLCLLSPRAGYTAHTDSFSIIAERLMRLRGTLARENRV